MALARCLAAAGGKIGNRRGGSSSTMALSDCRKRHLFLTDYPWVSLIADDPGPRPAVNPWRDNGRKGAILAFLDADCRARTPTG